MLFATVIRNIFSVTLPELGMPQRCRDNVTMFLVWLLHLDTEAFSQFFLVPDALLRCRVVAVVAQVYNCRVLSTELYSVLLGPCPCIVANIFIFYHTTIHNERIVQCTPCCHCQNLT